jgi:uncharacterized membrane protein
MRFPILVLHIIGGTVGMLSGFVTVFLRKGSRQHNIAGRVFVVSMLCMAAAGTYLAVLKLQPGNILGGTFTFYLVATAWMTARRKEKDVGLGIIDWCGLILVLSVSAVEITFGTQAAMSPTGLKFEYPPGPYLFIGSIAALAALGDARMLFRGGIAGTQRLARHLWRMCFALFVASGSIFLARAHLFPAFMRKTGMLFVLSFLPLALLVFWMIRVRTAKRYKAMRAGSAAGNVRQMRLSGALIPLAVRLGAVQREKQNV